MSHRVNASLTIFSGEIKDDISMVDFNLAVNYVLENEGGFIDSATDPGGATNFGISLRFLKSAEPESLKRANVFDPITVDTIRHLTVDQAKSLYLTEFWEKMPLLASLEKQHVANYIFDMAVNMGISPGIKIAQRACWDVLLNYPYFLDDGVLGNNTIANINKCQDQILISMRGERAGYYRKIVVLDISRADELKGWFDRTYRATT
jgi:lysozyme family protein